MQRSPQQLLEDFTKKYEECAREKTNAIETPQLKECIQLLEKIAEEKAKPVEQALATAYLGDCYLKLVALLTFRNSLVEYKDQPIYNEKLQFYQDNSNKFNRRFLDLYVGNKLGDKKNDTIDAINENLPLANLGLAIILQEKWKAKIMNRQLPENLPTIKRELEAGELYLSTAEKYKNHLKGAKLKEFEELLKATKASLLEMKNIIENQMAPQQTNANQQSSSP